MSLNSIKAKIAALLAKAESTDNQFEAETFMAKVNELLEKHQIDMYEIRKHETDSIDPLGKERGSTKLFNTHPWARLVANALAHYYGCRFVYGRMGNHITYDIIGRESARTTFELLFPFVLTQIRHQARKLWKDRPYQSCAVWEREVGQALTIRIWKIVPQAQQQRDEMAKNALIPLTDIEAYMNELFGDGLKTAKARDVRFSVAAEKAANSISINVQATGKHVKLIK